MEKKTTYTDSRKRALRKWREKNPEKVNEINKKASAVYYLKNKERKQRENLERYYRKKMTNETPKIQTLEIIEYNI